MICKFKHISWYNNELVYVCAPELLDVTSSGTAITNVFGKHESSKTHDDVGGFYATQGGTIIKYIPRDLTKFFPNLFAIKIFNGRIKELRQDDLREYTKLRFLELEFNAVTTLEKDLFKFNPELEVIGLMNNRITRIDSNIFDDLNKLIRLDLNQNECIGERHDSLGKSKSEISNLIEKIKENC